MVPVGCLSRGVDQRARVIQGRTPPADLHPAIGKRGATATHRAPAPGQQTVDGDIIRARQPAAGHGKGRHRRRTTGSKIHNSSAADTGIRDVVARTELKGDAGADTHVRAGHIRPCLQRVSAVGKRQTCTRSIDVTTVGTGAFQT